MDRRRREIQIEERGRKRERKGERGGILREKRGGYGEG